MSDELLNPEKALLFRIIHRENLPWILENGLYARTGQRHDPEYRNIRNDPQDPGKKERYQAEALIWKPVPLDGLLSTFCYNGCYAGAGSGGDRTAKARDPGLRAAGVVFRMITWAPRT